MKNLKFIYLSIVIAIFALSSCDRNETVIEPEPEAYNQSVSARSSMTELRTHFDNDGTLRTDNNQSGNILFDFCFDFQYPVTFSYNTGVPVTVNNFEELIDVLVTMTDDLYVDGIVFPFNVEVYDQDSEAVVVQVIASEEEFETLINSCGFDEVDDCICTEEFEPVCVEVQDPSGASFTISFPNECVAICEGFATTDFVDCDDFTNPNLGEENECFDFVYPISVVDSEGNTTVINSDEEWETIMYTSCDSDFVYPFDVTLAADQSTQTVTSAEDFMTVLDSCSWYNEVDPIECWDFVYPVNIISSTGTVTVNNADEAAAVIAPMSMIEFPFEVTIGDVVVEITTPNNFFEVGGWESRCE